MRSCSGKTINRSDKLQGKKQETEPFSFDHLIVIILVFYITNIINHEKSFPISFKSNCTSEALLKLHKKLSSFTGSHGVLDDIGEQNHERSEKL